MTDITPEQLSAYLDNALTPAERSVVDRAIADSPALRRDLDVLRRTQAWVRELPAPGVPTGFEQRVLRAIQKPRARTNWWIVAPSAFGAVATALLMILVVQQEKPAVAPAPRAAALNELVFPVAKAAAPRLAEARGRRQKDKEAPERLDDRAAADAMAPAEDPLPEGASRRIWSSISTAALPAVSRQSAPTQEKEKSSGHGAAGFANASLAEGKISRDGPVGLKKAASPPVLEWRGDDSGITDFREVVVRTDADWRTLWKAHTAHRVPPPPVPPVDFTSAQVVGVFLGQRSSGGYAVDILSLSDEADARTVTYREIRPPANTLQITVLTQPFHLRTVPRRDGPVRFRKK